MSLLFDALKRAQEGDDGVEAEDQFIDLSTPEPTNPAGDIPVKDVGVHAARSILSATARLPRRIVLFVVGGLVVLLLAGGGGLWYYQRTVGSLVSQSAIPPPPASTTVGLAAPPQTPAEAKTPVTPGTAGVEPPLTEVVPAPPTPSPSPANNPAQGTEKVAAEAGVKGTEVKPAEVKPAEVKPAEVKPAEVKPAEVKPTTEVKTAEVKPPAEVKAKPAPAEAIVPAPQAAAKVTVSPAPPKAKPESEEANPAQEAQTEWISPRQRARHEPPAKVNAPPKQAVGDSAPNHIRLSPTIDPLREGYKALTEGRMSEAERLYQEVIAKTPHERDALLGLAVIAQRKMQTERALDLYRQVLNEDPGNATATAAMVNLTMQADPVAAESRLKLLLDRNQTSPELYHVLGRVFAIQKRWGEAQQAFFQAFTHDPGNAQYAYNLAVSLDHLHKPAAAIPYYEKSVQILKPGDASLDRRAILQRVQELQSSLPEQR